MFGTPEESITPSKRRGMLTAAQCYLTANDCWHRRWRIDMVAVEFDKHDGIVRLDVVRDAVEGN
jgi:Holliday junction resolvase-like predicted endonuclease